MVQVSFRPLWIAALLLLCCLRTEAGSAPASSSKVPGVLLGFAYEGMHGIEAYFETGHSKGFIDAFKDACVRKKRIWALGMPSVFVCTKLEYIEEAGNGPVYALQLSAKDGPSHARSAIVLSLEPLSIYPLVPRQLEASETHGLQSVYKSGSLSQAIKAAVDTGDIRILDIKNKSSSIYIAKWKRVRSSEDSDNDHYLVINRDGEKFFSAGNFEGSILGFVDINNDGVPEVQRSINCDGTCEAITSIYRNTRDLVSIYNH